MTKNKIQQVPLQAKMPINVEHTNWFPGSGISDLPPTTIHFYDESSVVKTTINRRYGNAPLGEPAYKDTHQKLILPSTFYTRCRK